VIREERPGDRAPVREVEIAIGTALMHGGLARITGPVVLLGHPAYYTRFGFRPAFPLGVTNQWGIEGPEWMIRGDASPGEVRFPEPFATHG
jgi:predicted N-acetyltransferase YhbS